MKLFFDFEFTGLKQSAHPISLGIVSEYGWTFYAEFTDVNLKEVNPWVRENVLPGLKQTDNEFIFLRHSVSGNSLFIRDRMLIWMSLLALPKGEKFEMWGDCLAYDWVLFCELFGGAMNLPDNIYYIPFDLATLFLTRGVDPDISRELYGGFSGTKHNARDDALAIRSCYRRVTTSYTAVTSLGGKK
jgi:hypothetical protein